MRIFDVRIPAGDTTLYHRHGRDSIYVAISGTTKLVTQEYGKASKPLLIKPGDVSYTEHSKSPFTHRVSNLSSDEFHVIDIEVLDNSMASGTTLETLPSSYQPVLENARV